MAIVGADQVTIVDLTDGYSVFMAPESYAFPATTTAAIPGSVPCLVSALIGPDPIAASVVVGEITKPSGVTVASDAHASTPTLTITVDGTVTTPGVVTVPVHVGDVTITKRFAFSLAKTGSTGSSGTSATNVIIGNEAAVIPCTAAGATVSASTITIPFAGYTGASRAATTVAVTTLPTGITVGTNTAATTGADGSLVLNVANTSTLGGATNGIITLTFTANSQTFVKLFKWTKAIAGTNGTNGTNGTDGADALVMAVTSSNGTIFKNSAVATTLTAHVYSAGVELTAPQIAAIGTVKWYKDGNATAVGTGVSLVIDAGQVTNKALYEARLES